MQVMSPHTCCDNKADEHCKLIQELKSLKWLADGDCCWDLGSMLIRTCCQFRAIGRSPNLLLALSTCTLVLHFKELKIST